MPGSIIHHKSDNNHRQGGRRDHQAKPPVAGHLRAVTKTKHGGYDADHIAAQID